MRRGGGIAGLKRAEEQRGKLSEQALQVGRCQRSFVRAPPLIWFLFGVQIESVQIEAMRDQLQVRARTVCFPCRPTKTDRQTNGQTDRGTQIWTLTLPPGVQAATGAVCGQASQGAKQGSCGSQTLPGDVQVHRRRPPHVKARLLGAGGQVDHVVPSAVLIGVVQILGVGDFYYEVGVQVSVRRSVQCVRLSAPDR
jgi:hypothetical protein